MAEAMKDDQSDDGESENEKYQAEEEDEEKSGTQNYMFIQAFE